MTVISYTKTLVLLELLILIGLKMFENLKHEIKFIIKSNESLAENKIENEIEQLFLKYTNRNNVHEHGKQQNK